MREVQKGGALSQLALEWVIGALQKAWELTQLALVQATGEVGRGKPLLVLAG